MHEYYFWWEAARFLFFLEVLEHRVFRKDHEELLRSNYVQEVQSISLQFLELRHSCFPAGCKRSTRGNETYDFPIFAHCIKGKLTTPLQSELST